MSPGAVTARQLVLARRAIRSVESLARRHDIEHAAGTVRWRQWGQGDPLVLLHGGHGTWMHWIRNIERLSAVRSVLVPDMPGFGDSDALPSDDPHDPARHHALVSVLRESLGRVIGPATPFDLAGFSFGGLVAAHLAASTAGVRRLALLGPAGHGGPRPPMRELVNWRNAPPERRLAIHAHNLGALMLHDPGSIDAQALLVHACASRRTRYHSKSISRTAVLRATLDAYDGEVLIVWGEHDVTGEPGPVGRLLTVDHGRRHWRRVTGAGHWVQYEKSAETDVILKDWFVSRRSDSPARASCKPTSRRC